MLIPAFNSSRPFVSRLLFDKISTPVQAASQPESLQERLVRLPERFAFFWMMTAITAKYIVRSEATRIQWLIAFLHEIVGEIERLIVGEAWRYERSMTMPLSVTRDEQLQAVRALCEPVLSLMPAAAALGAVMLPAPTTEIDSLLKLAEL